MWKAMTEARNDGKNKWKRKSGREDDERGTRLLLNPFHSTNLCEPWHRFIALEDYGIDVWLPKASFLGPHFFTCFTTSYTNVSFLYRTYLARDNQLNETIRLTAWFTNTWIQIILLAAILCRLYNL